MAGNVGEASNPGPIDDDTANDLEDMLRMKPDEVHWGTGINAKVAKRLLQDHRQSLVSLKSATRVTSDGNNQGAGWRTPPPGEVTLEGVNRSCRGAAPLPPSSPPTDVRDGRGGSLPAMAVVGGHPETLDESTMGHKGWRTPPPAARQLRYH